MNYVVLMLPFNYTQESPEVDMIKKAFKGKKYLTFIPYGDHKPWNGKKSFPIQFTLRDGGREFEGRIAIVKHGRSLPEMELGADNGPEAIKEKETAQPEQSSTPALQPAFAH